MNKSYSQRRRLFRIGLIGLSLLIPILIVGLFWYQHSQLPPQTCITVPTTIPNPVTVPTTAPDPVTAPPETAPEDTTAPQPDPVLEIMNTMTLSDKIYQLFIVSPEQLTGEQTVVSAGEQMRLTLGEQPVGGLIFFKANLLSRNQTALMLQNAQDYTSLGLFLAVDEEGGTVSRLGSNPMMGTTKFPSMGTVSTEEQAFHVGSTIGKEIRELGFNLDFAPVADVNSNPSNPVIGMRSFSSDPTQAARLVASCVKGFRGSGMICTLKHFPGHGDTKTDSHLGAAETTKTLAELRECEFLPFRSGMDAGAQMVMVGHISAPKVTGNQVPATLSRQIITDLLRGELQFDGVVVTDSLMMQAVTDHYAPGEAAVLALEAGADILLLPKDLREAHDGILDALQQGRITEQRIDESIRRILNLKLEYGIL